MAPFHLNPAWVNGVCLAAALAMTLILAAFLTPRHWWRRANARALAVLAGGTALFGYLFMLGASAWFPPSAPAHMAAITPAPVAVPVHTYRVFDDLNLRAGSGTGAARIAVVPGGANVTTTGRRDGDWWEVTATVAGRPVTGWASSLWLRRDDEGRARQAP
jgi:hypothetical protein